MASLSKPWVAYLRVSTDEQAQHGVSLRVQRESCAAYLLAHGLPIGEVIEDGGQSAKNLKRPGMQRLLGMITRGEIAGVVAWKLDRLSRSVRDLWDLIEKAESCKVAVACVMEKIDTSGPFGRFAVTMMGALAQLEREQIAERVTGAIRHIKARGGFHGGRIPTGFKAVGERGARQLVIVPAIAEKMAPLWSMIANGSSLNDLAAYLNANLRGLRKNTWAINSIADMIRNEKYIGTVVSRDEFDRGILALESRWSPRSPTGTTSPRGKKPTRLYVLSGLAFCLHCGGALTGTYGTGRNGVVHYYRCTSAIHRGKAGCRSRMLPAGPWERVVFKALRKALDDKRQLVDAWEAIAEVHRAKVGPLEDERVLRTKERDRLVVQVSNLVDALEMGGAAARAAQQKLEQRQAELEVVSVRLAGIEGQLSAAFVAEGNLAAVVDLYKAEMADLADATPEEQQSALRGMVRRVGLAADIPRIELELIIDTAPGAGSRQVPKWRTLSDMAHVRLLALHVALTLRPRGPRSYPDPEVASG